MASSDEATLEGLSMLAWTTVLGVVCQRVVAGHGHFRVQLICGEECWQGQFNHAKVCTPTCTSIVSCRTELICMLFSFAPL